MAAFADQHDRHAALQSGGYQRVALSCAGAVLVRMKVERKAARSRKAVSQDELAPFWPTQHEEN